MRERAREAARGEEGGVRVRVERAREGGPDVDHALHEGQVEVVPEGEGGGEGAEDVEELAGVALEVLEVRVAVRVVGGHGGCAGWWLARR